MKSKNITVSIILFSFFLMRSSFVNNSGEKGNLPEGWSPAGLAPVDYEMGLDKEIFHSGKSSGFIKSKPDNPIGFGTLMQMCQAKDYIGKRIKMVSYIRVYNIKNWAGMWLRVDGPGKHVLSFDNMKKDRLRILLTGKNIK